MASTFSPSLRLELIGDGDQSGIWGQTTNNNLGALVEQAIAGVVTINMLDTNYTMSNFNGVSDESRNQVLVLTGTNTAQRNLIAPLVEKTYVVKNSTVGGFAVQIIGSSGTGVVIPNGVTTSVYCDGLNFYSATEGTTGNFIVNGNLAVTGTTTLTGALGGSTATFSGAISSVSPAFTGTPTAPTASAGTNTTQIATTAFVLANGVPTGGLVMWPTGTAPNGFLLCTGTAVSRTTYAALFAVIGTTFGVGDNSTTFNLPNYTNRMPYGTTVGATGGSADATLVSHSHTFTGNALGDHSHTMNFNQTSKGNNATPFMLSSPINGENLQGTLTLTTTNASAGTPSGSISTAGSSATNANLPPYLGINFIIKT
jgi:microcystin-dependent protein